MSAKKTVNVVIGDKLYCLSAYEEKEYLEKVASYINGKLEEVGKLENYKSLNSDMKTVLLEINIADDYFKAKERVDSMEAEIKQKDQEIYNLKQDLVSRQVKDTESENQLKSLEEENRELKLNKTKLEASLEDALLGGVGDKDSDDDSED